MSCFSGNQIVTKPQSLSSRKDALTFRKKVLASLLFPWHSIYSAWKSNSGKGKWGIFTGKTIQLEIFDQVYMAHTIQQL